MVLLDFSLSKNQAKKNVYLCEPCALERLKGAGERYQKVNHRKKRPTKTRKTDIGTGSKNEATIFFKRNIFLSSLTS